MLPNYTRTDYKNNLKPIVYRLYTPIPNTYRFYTLLQTYTRTETPH